MSGGFFSGETAQERVTSDLPKIKSAALKEQRIKICSALEEARAHKERLMLPLAKQRQDKIIQYWITTLAAFDKQHSEDDSWLTN